MDYEVKVGGDLTAEICEYTKNFFTVTDRKVYGLYREFFSKNTFIAEEGEASKSMKVAEEILSDMLNSGLDRTDTVVAVGGGVIGDLTGFVSALYMRGIKFINIPTTLLAMVDSSVGGKTAVNLNHAKNVVGVFKKPEKVLISAHFLKTLSKRELESGWGEIIKTACLDKLVYDYASEVLEGKCDLNAAFIRKLVDFKTRITTEDFKETGVRRILNFGHTIGHALESADNFTLSHGEYVFKGCLIELEMFKDQINSDFYRRITPLFRGCDCRGFEIDEIGHHIKFDKKNISGKIGFALPYDFNQYLYPMVEEREVYNKLAELKSGKIL